MIKSKFIANILDLLLDGDDLGRKFRPQLNFLTEKEYTYSHAGLFIGFSHDPGIEEFRAVKDNLILNGVIIRAKEIEDCAEAILHFSNGVVNYLEIWSYSGEYPKVEFDKYTLTQEWVGSSRRKIIV